MPVLMDIMEALNELTEEEFLELLLVIYDMGAQERGTIETNESRMRRIRIRVEEWLEI